MDKKINKYNSFFEEMLHLAGLLKLSDIFIYGVQDNNLSEVEVTHNFKLDICIYSFLKKFGNEIKIKEFGSSDYSYTLESIGNAHKIADKLIRYNEIPARLTISGHDTVNINQLIFLSYDEVGSVFSTVLKGKENPHIYLLWWGDDNLEKSPYNFTTNIRNRIYWGLLSVFSNNPPKAILESKIIDIEWMKFYDFLFTKESGIRSQLIIWREEYSMKTMKMEQITNELLSFDKFEINFIKFIMQKDESLKSINRFSINKLHSSFKDYL